MLGGTNEESKLWIGGYNESYIKIGEGKESANASIQWLPNIGEYYWYATLGGMSLGTSDLKLKTKTAMFDTGFSFSTMPKKDMD